MRYTPFIDGRPLSVIGFGGMAVAGVYGAVDEPAVAGLLDDAIAAGLTHLDTADVYGNGGNERLLGPIVRRHRDRLVLATKGGATRDANGQASCDGSPAYLRQAVDASLARLGIDTIDLYYLHRPDPAVPIEESVGALGELVKAGKLKALGLSEVSADTLRRAHRTHPIFALQSEYSIGETTIAAALRPTCQELGVRFVAYSPLGRGLWTGALPAPQALANQDMRRVIPRFSDEHLPTNLALVARLEALAAPLGVSAAQLALAWLLAQGDDVLPIPGTRSPARLQQNLAAADLTIPTDVLAELNRISARVAGARHTPSMLARTGH